MMAVVVMGSGVMGTHIDAAVVEESIVAAVESHTASAEATV